MKTILTWAGLILLAGLLIGFLYNRRFIVGLIQYGGQAKQGALAVGDKAPSYEVWSVDGTSSQPLEDFFGSKPIVLVFGSFT